MPWSERHIHFISFFLSCPGDDLWLNENKSVSKCLPQLLIALLILGMGVAGRRGQVREAAAAVGCGGAQTVGWSCSTWAVVHVLCLFSCCGLCSLLPRELEICIVMHWSTVRGVCTALHYTGWGTWQVCVCKLTMEFSPSLSHLRGGKGREGEG